MDKYEMYKTVPHFDLIEENKPVVIPSIFMFNSNEELYPFLAACKEYNCKVFFENEKLIVSPNDGIETTIELFAYSTVVSCRKIGNDYVRYLSNLSLMKWAKESNE
jgi:hypothetical protein